MYWRCMPPAFANVDQREPDRTPYPVQYNQNRARAGSGDADGQPVCICRRAPSSARQLPDLRRVRQPGPRPHIIDDCLGFVEWDGAGVLGMNVLGFQR